MVAIKDFSLLALGATSLLSTVLAHPGEVLSTLTVKRQAALTELIAARGAEKLARCADSISARSFRQRAIARRAAKTDALRKRMSKRTTAETEAYDYSHNYTGSVSSDDAFSTNTSCILEPQLTIGPYWVEGELIRSDPTEDQEGVAMQLELEFVDINTCEPVSGLYIDLWNANSTGVYSGVKESSLDSTYLRAIQITDGDGTVTYDTLVPGHYQGRATHSHVMVHQDVTAYSNGTYAGGTVRSISQLFYDTEFRAAVEAVEPYSSNTQTITTNEEDSLLSATTLGDYDPFVKYIYLGDSIEDGVFAWHSIGIDLTANYTSNESAASHYYATGGVDESSSSSFGGSGSGGPGGNSTGGSFNGTGMPSNMSGSMPVSGAAAGTGSVTASTGTFSIASSATTTATTTTSVSGAAGTKIGSYWGKSKSVQDGAKSTQQASQGEGHDSKESGSEQGPLAHSGRPSGFQTLPSGSKGPHEDKSDAASKAKTTTVTSKDEKATAIAEHQYAATSKHQGGGW
ncbi:hypothetical protein AMS68_003970 [Peltaster fructicola]|uniref:Intradiol ring-cleavage dioxygenases domain-containing protein n=1 Tax=Peltaster fructicola TaxID=286661 RepID=A0A6H0XUP2_9PEZI|nr:hypothetical protein AMS68_003970 [Peltaster fructicola]